MSLSIFKQNVWRVAGAVLLAWAGSVGVAAEPAAAIAPDTATPNTFTLVDALGNAVQVRQPVRRIATIGAVPVLNSFVFALGAGDKLINGLPPFAQQPRWTFQYIFAPHTRTLPSLQNPDNSPRLEALLHARPDLVLTMTKQSYDVLRTAGLPVAYIAWRDPQDIKQGVDRLAQALGRQEQAARYHQHFDDTLAGIRQQLAQHAPKAPRVLFLSNSALTQSMIADWWIAQAGGISVSEDGSGRWSEARRSFTVEQILAWDPEILIVLTHKDAKILREDPRFAALSAIRHNRVLVTPAGAHVWGHRSTEQVLTVLWAATQFHPQIFSRETLVEQTRRFYLDIYGIALTNLQIEDILSGRGTALPPMP